MKRILTLSLVLAMLVGCSDTTDEVTEETNTETEVYTLVEKDELYEITEGKDYPLATIVLETGDEIVVELNPDMAPNTVNNFIDLANSGFYDGVFFHRVIEGFMIQTGDPQGTGMGGPGYSISGEMSNNGFAQNTLKNNKGTISMARSTSYDSAGSQFFINVVNNGFLDGEYTVFGNVVEGYSVVEAISKVGTSSQDRPYEDVIIKTITVDTKGVDYPQPEIIK